MYHKKHTFMLRFAALLLAIVLLIPVNANAAVVEPVQPMASYYLSSYNAYVYPAGNGEVHVYFSVIGVDYLDELGALTIQLYESPDNSTWYRAISYSNFSTPSMLGYDEIYYSNHVEYQGVAGRYYKAYVCIWGGRDGAGDTRYFWTSARQAT